MTGPLRPPTRVRPAALVLVAVAVVLASCSGSEPSVAPSRTRSTAESAPASTTPPEPSGTSTPKPDKPKPPKPKPKPKPHRAFAFQVSRSRPTVTSKNMRRAKIRRAMNDVVPAVKQRFNELFRQTYVDPRHWKEGKYWDAFQSSFGGFAREVAGKSKRKLTLGPFAGREFESVREAIGRLTINVLIGSRGGPVTASVQARFNEKAVRPNGRTTVVVSEGSYFLQPVSKRGWVIVAFHVGRHDHPL